jgi:hypothetical protein
MFIPDPGVKRQKGTGFRIRTHNTELTKNLSVFYPKNCYLAVVNMIRDVYTGIRISDPGEKKTGSRIRIPNTALDEQN